jgi:ATP-binding cassette subfamily B protein
MNWRAGLLAPLGVFSRRTGITASEGGWLRRLARYCWRYRRNVGIALGGALLVTVATAAIPLVQRQIIDNVILTRRQSIWPLAVVLLIAAAVNFGGIFLRRY